jgi:hypothetical protein
VISVVAVVKVAKRDVTAVRSLLASQEAVLTTLKIFVNNRFLGLI